MYDPYFQNLGGKAGGAAGKKGQEDGKKGQGVFAEEGKLEQIRVKKLKFTLKGSNYEDAQNAGLSGRANIYKYVYIYDRAHFYR